MGGIDFLIDGLGLARRIFPRKRRDLLQASLAQFGAQCHIWLKTSQRLYPAMYIQ
jgi:hypothetical protein